MVDWIVILLLMGLYFAFANEQFVDRVGRLAAGRRNGWFLALGLFLPYLLLALSEKPLAASPLLSGAGRMLLYLLVPVGATLLRPPGAKALHPLDILAVLAIWFPIEFGWLPDLEASLGDVGLPVPLMTGMVLAFFCFLVLRPLPAIGYSFRLTRVDLHHILQGLTAYTLLGIPLGLVTRFLAFGVAPFDLGEWVLAWPLGYLFTALPEEMLFRGVIQNQIQQRVRQEWAALALASAIFGLAHLNNGTTGYPEPNWMYAVMATLAGMAYGWTWRKTGKITASAAVHATVNYVWGILLHG